MEKFKYIEVKLYPFFNNQKVLEYFGSEGYELVAITTVSPWILRLFFWKKIYVFKKKL